MVVAFPKQSVQPPFVLLKLVIEFSAKFEIITTNSPQLNDNIGAVIHAPNGVVGK